MPSDDHSHDHGHAHGHGHPEMSELSDLQLRVRALELILTEKGYIDPAALDQIVETFETRIGPHVGAKIVARAWADPEFKARLLADATEAANSLGHDSPVGSHLIAIENTPAEHNLVVCTLCSCYPWEVLGLPPVWYKSAPFRSRAVIDPRSVLADFGVALPQRPKSAFGIPPPRRGSSSCRCGPPEPTAGARSGLRRWSRATAWSAPACRNRPRPPRGPGMSNTVHDMGGMHGFGPVVPEPNEPPFHESWESRVFAMQRAMGYTRLWTIDAGRASLETLPPLLYLASSYYQRWFLGLERRLQHHGLVGRDEIAAGKSLRPAVGLNRKLTVGEVDRVKVRGNFERPGPDASEIQGRRPGSRPKHQPDDAYTPAALCEGQDRHDRGDPRLPRLPGHSGAGRRRRSAVALCGRVHRPGAVGRRRRPVDQGIDRSVPSHHLDPA